MSEIEGRRQLFLDTETTGFSHKYGHRVIELGVVEMIDRKVTGRHLHYYFKPDIQVDEGAFRVHGISNEQLKDAPVFEEKIEEIMSFLEGAEVIIHNAPFDIGFLNAELMRLSTKNVWGQLENICEIVDSLLLARKKHPGQKNALDALCKRYMVSNEHRKLHGALLDSQLLAEVYLLMTGGQTVFSWEEVRAKNLHNSRDFQDEGGLIETVIDLPIIYADADALKAHEKYMSRLKK